MAKLSGRQKDLVEKIDLGLRPQIIKLRRLLMSENYNRTTSIDGASLNSSAITDTYTSIKRNIDNRDRYETYWRIPTVRCGFSFSIDFSGSMDSGPNPTTWEKVLSTAFCVGRLTQNMGVESNCAIVGVSDSQSSSAYGATERYVAEAIVLKELKEKWNDDLFTELWSYQPCTGTYVSQYIQVAIDMAKRINASKRIAFFLTDGADPGVYPYLQSLVDLAKAQGIHLIGIVYTRDEHMAREYSKRIPNNVVIVNDPKELGIKMVKIIDGLVRK
jgi:hypothetical protein